MRVLVTGGAGFIGSNFVDALVASGLATGGIAVLDDLSTGSRANLDGIDVELIEGSVTDAEVVTAAAEGADAIVHLAAIGSVPQSIAEPAGTHAVNATGTALVMEAARPAGAYVVVASSAAVYGPNPALPTGEDLPLAPISPYAASKVTTEAYALAWGAAYGLDVLALRFFNVFGPRQPPRHSYAAVVPAFVDAAVRGVPLPVHGDGGQTRDFVFVGDVCRILVDALARRVAHPTPVNLSPGTRISLLELIAELEAVVGHPLERAHTNHAPGDVRDSQADPSVLRRLFPAIEPTPLRAGLEATVAWFEEAKPEPRG